MITFYLGIITETPYYWQLKSFKGQRIMTLPTKIAVTGASGFVGTQLVKMFVHGGCNVLELTRQDVVLPPDELAVRLAGCQGVINLAGAPVMRFWNKKYKQMMYESRVALTHNLVTSFGLMETKPQLFISTSATGIYANDGIHTEEKNTLGTGFLAHLAQAWEAEAMQATQHGIRTALFRFGVVLGRSGGPVGEMLLPFKLGVGGKIGTGQQAFSWIHLNDLLQAYVFVFKDETCAGTYNLVAPHPSTNSGMTMALGKALSRPTIFTIPAAVLKLRFGEGAQILTSGQKALPKRLIDAGFAFEFTDIEAAMRDCVL